MTEPASEKRAAPARLRRVWKRLSDSRRGRIEMTALAVSALLFTVAAFEVLPALAEGEKLQGDPVPDADVPAVVAAALSCPTLTAPRVAGQIMAISGFTATKDFAGIGDKLWTKWKPTTESVRSDRAANIMALGHRTCELVGQARSGKVKGDLWAAAVAAERVGVDKVIKAGGVPDEAQEFVDKVTAYANWYAAQPVFKAGDSDTDVAPSAPTDVDAVPVPDEYVEAVNAAGRICPDVVTPARIAAQLRAASGFNPNKRGDGDAAGIAQFTDALWKQYQSDETASRWNPDDAIPLLGSTLCDMTHQLNVFGGDKWQLAVGAFQWGPTRIRQAEGHLPRVNVPQLAEEAAKYLPEYEKDPRLALQATKPPASSSSPSPSPSKSSASPSPSPSSESPTEEPTEEEEAPAYDPEALYQLQNAWAGEIVEVPGIDDPAVASGARVQLWTNEHYKDQYWTVEEAPEKGYYILTNAFRGLALGIENGSKDNEAKLVVIDKKTDDPNQQWKLQDAGDGQLNLINRNSGKALDLLGDDLGPPMNDNSNWNGYLVEQWDLQTYAKDQRWLLIKS